MPDAIELMEKWGVDLNRIHVRAFYNMNTILTPQIVELGPETEEGGKPEVYKKLPEHMDRDCMYVFRINPRHMIQIMNKPHQIK